MSTTPAINFSSMSLTPLNSLSPANFRNNSKWLQWNTWGPGGHWFMKKNWSRKSRVRLPLSMGSGGGCQSALTQHRETSFYKLRTDILNSILKCANIAVPLIILYSSYCAVRKKRECPPFPKIENKTNAIHPIKNPKSTVSLQYLYQLTEIKRCRGDYACVGK